MTATEFPQSRLGASTRLLRRLGTFGSHQRASRSPATASDEWKVQDFADDAVSRHRWPVLALLEAGVPVTLLADLFAAHGPDSAHIYRHEPAADDTYWLHAEVDAALADVATRIGS